MDTSVVVVLVVEDDPLIHDIVGEALVDGGFMVAQASTPEDARDMIDAPDAPYRALVTDINLAPGKPTGWDLARRAREINSDLPVVYMTGDSQDQWATYGVPNSVLITKPFAPSQVTTAVSQLLNAASPTPT
ncbi:response regulator [Bradyrhizobium sp. 4]|uniref:response regulator n=1 Tax=Bradyrhizobium sp. 4 TaxID=2782678 RepID=UPI001FFF75D1|nr:response regulator [Bradyrhizobium sp. 4]UPJ35829.1 response regulator [Bradyrhizobium sp. 4]